MLLASNPCLNMHVLDQKHHQAGGRPLAWQFEGGLIPRVTNFYLLQPCQLSCEEVAVGCMEIVNFEGTQMGINKGILPYQGSSIIGALLWDHRHSKLQEPDFFCRII
jgi:hypothetical protein